MSTGRLGAGDTAIQPTIFDAKADILTATAADTPARLAVGANDTVLTADSTTATGLKWAAAASVPESLGFTAGKNKIINGDFRINQRGFSSTTTDGVFGFDRWLLQTSGGSTYSAQTFTVGTAPVVGYEGINFARVATTGQSGAGVYTTLSQRIESVRTFANQTITVSFWAKASSGTPSIAVELVQNFGSGGSPSSVVNTFVTKQQITTSWARYSASVAVPSINGKTLGTTNDGYLSVDFWTSAGTTYNARTNSLGIQTATIDFWGVQVEAGNTATAFQTATGTLAGELAACQRYFLRYGDSSNQALGAGMYYSTTDSYFDIMYPVIMRGTPTVTIGEVAGFTTFSGGSGRVSTDAVGQVITNKSNRFKVVTAAATTGDGALWSCTSATNFISISAEL
jgi:hypothetical protein